MRRLFHVKSVLALLLLVFTLAASLPAAYLQPAKAVDVKALEQHRKANQQKLRRIKEIKRQLWIKEKNVSYNIVQNQKLLDYSKSSLQAQQEILNRTREELNVLENALNQALIEQQELSNQMGKRLRSLYVGERLGFVHMFLSAGNLATLMDRMYYKKRIFQHDKALYEAYIFKTQVLEDKKNELTAERERLAGTINRIESYQTQLQESMVLDRLLIAKLRTSREAYEAAENQLQHESSRIAQQIIAATRRGGYVFGSTGRLAAPVYAAMTSGFGYRVHPIFRSRRFHSGIDFGAGYGTPIRAADGGVVIHSGWQGGYGKVVIINHGTQGGGNLATLYGHMSSTAVSGGQQISKGQVIGYVGNTGYSTGAHLHFEVRVNGSPVNPLGYLR